MNHRILQKGKNFLTRSLPAGVNEQVGSLAISGRKMALSNLGRDTDCHDMFFPSVFLSPAHADAGIIPEIKPRPLPSTCLPVRIY
jgi:hypothetical protein